MPTQPKHLDRVPYLDRWRGIAILLAPITAVAAPLWHLHVINRFTLFAHVDLEGKFDEQLA